MLRAFSPHEFAFPIQRLSPLAMMFATLGARSGIAAEPCLLLNLAELTWFRYSLCGAAEDMEGGPELPGGTFGSSGGRGSAD